MQTKTSLVILLLVLSFGAFAQSKKKTKKKQEEAATIQGPTSLTPSPGMNERVYAPAKKTKKLSKGATYSAEEDFRKRMELVAKEKRKAEKEMMKPQYSDPSYFGHKKKPKRHSRKKMKYCKECGIRH